jgi:hypothetical protein
MGMRTLLRRIERAEVILKAQSILSPDCICFPEMEQPFFGFDYEAEIAFQVKCSLHGDRFQPRVRLFKGCFPEWARDSPPRSVGNQVNECNRDVAPTEISVGSRPTQQSSTSSHIRCPYSALQSQSSRLPVPEQRRSALQNLYTRDSSPEDKDSNDRVDRAQP